MSYPSLSTNIHSVKTAGNDIDSLCLWYYLVYLPYKCELKIVCCLLNYYLCLCNRFFGLLLLATIQLIQYDTWQSHFPRGVFWASEMQELDIWQEANVGDGVKDLGGQCPLQRLFEVILVGWNLSLLNGNITITSRSVIKYKESHTITMDHRHLYAQ